LDERRLTNSLCRLLSSSGLGRLAQEALLETLEERYASVPAVKTFSERLRRSPIAAVEPKGRPVPDLVLVGDADEDGTSEIFAVVEVKLKAAASICLLSTAARMMQIEDSIAIEVRRDLTNYPKYNYMSQIDLYRTRKWWVRSVAARRRNPSISMKMTSPEDTLWLLFDSKGRSAATAFLDRQGVEASSATQWLTVDLWEFHERLMPHLSDLSLPATDRALLAEVLDHIETTRQHKRTRPPVDTAGVL
jgi:hypothetical protein